jgi:hypothetical protein
MKNSIRIFLAASIVFVVGCSSFLEEDLVTGVSADTHYTSPGGFEDAVSATYEPLRSFYARELGMTVTVFGTDTYTNGSDGSHKGINQYDARLNAEESYFAGVWSDFYEAINQANAVVGRADNIEGLEEEVKTTRVAETRFLRALYYFNLVRMYGDIHLSLEETEGVQIEASRTPAAEIYSTAIIPDLEFAISNLPDVQDEYGRATRPAAEHLLAKVLLTRGYADYAESGDFSRAAELAETVINDYGFELLDQWEDVFDINNQQHQEVVWSVQYTQDILINGPGNNAHLYFLMEYDVLPGMQRDLANGRPWKRFNPTNYLLGVWNRDIDVRYEEGFKDVFLANNPASIPEGGNGNPAFSIGDTAIYLPGRPVDQSFRESKAYMVIAPGDYTEKLYPTLTKFLDPQRADVNATEGSRDFMLMRLAGTHMIAAEAYFQTGNNSQAAEHLNMVRTRAARSGSEADMEITASDVTLDFILDERARELVGEMHRWFTLVRTNTLVERVQEHNPSASGNIQSFHSLRPIPQEQIDRTPAGYSQNEGY